MRALNFAESSNIGGGGQSSKADLGMRSFSVKEMVNRDRVEKPKEHTDLRDMGCKGSFKRVRSLKMPKFAKSLNNGASARSSGAELRSTQSLSIQEIVSRGSTQSLSIQEIVSRDRAEKPKQHTSFRHMGSKGSFKPRLFLCLRRMSEGVKFPTNKPGN